MSAETKKWINRGGLVSIIIGVIAYLVTGGEAGTAGQVVTLTSGIVGSALILIREIIG